MPDRIRLGEGALPPTINALLRRGEGYGWVSGCGVTLTDNTTDIEVRVDDGRVVAGGVGYDISETTKTLPDGDGQNPRKDLVVVDFQGTVTVVTGEPAAADPPDRRGEFTTSPAPPSAASIDGTLLAEVWVPAGATDNSDLDADDIADRRVADAGALGAVSVLDQRPAESDLVRTRLWRNTNAGQFEAYVADTDEIVTFSTTQVTSFSGPTTRVVEDYEDGLGGSWNSSTDELEHNTPSFEGNAAGHLDTSVDSLSRLYSVPGDGLPYYAESGDTITLAVYSASAEYIDLGFGKEDPDFEKDNRIRADFADNEFSVLRADDRGDWTELATTSVSLSGNTWYWMEVDYDGGGTGIHPARLYSTDTSTDPGTKDTKLADLSSPTKDTTYRGRGYATTIWEDGRIDYLTAVTS